MSDDAALAYHERHGPQALLIARDGHIVLERYGGDFKAADAHALYSGTKSFWGVTAAAAADDGLLSFDEPVAATLAEYRADARKRAVTIRHMLDLSSGHAFGGLGAGVPVPAKAVALPLTADPGTRFVYGGIPLQVFGEVLRRKLGRSPHDYLRERILDPAGIAIARWRELADGTQPLPTGAFMTAQAWLRYGRLLLGAGTIDGTRIVSAESFAAVVAPSAANPKYGLGVWRDVVRDGTTAIYASGAGGQALYTIAAARLAVVRFGNGKSWNHGAFLRALVT